MSLKSYFQFAKIEITEINITANSNKQCPSTLFDIYSMS